MLSSPQTQSTTRRWGIVIFLLVLMAILVFGIILLFDTVSSPKSLEFIPISLQSNLSANYQAAAFSGEIAVMDLLIIEEAISDRNLFGDNPEINSEEIVNDLLTPVPTVTPAPSQTSTQPGGDENQATSTITPTINPSSSATIVPSETATTQSDGSPTATSNASPIPSITATLTPTLTTTLTPTNTLTVTPSFTPSKTATTIPSITPTKTPTATLDVCALIEITDFKVKKNKITWVITNNSSETILLSELIIDWPLSNVQLKKVKLNGRTIWDIKNDTPPTHLSSDWKGLISLREIASGESVKIEFEFDKKAESIGYYLQFDFSNSCRIFAEE